jgi:hypothetical protein
LAFVAQTEVVDGQDVGQSQTACSLSFDLKPFQGVGARHHMLVQHLDRNDAIHKTVARLIHKSHTAATNHFQNLVTVRQYGADEIVLDKGREDRSVVRTYPQIGSKFSAALDAASARCSVRTTW